MIPAKPTLRLQKLPVLAGVVVLVVSGIGLTQTGKLGTGVSAKRDAVELPAPPPTVEFLGATVPTGGQTWTPGSQTPTVWSDDAMLLWLRVKFDDNQMRSDVPLVSVTDDRHRPLTLWLGHSDSNDLVEVHVKKGYDTTVRNLTLSVTNMNGALLEQKLPDLPPTHAVDLQGRPAAKPFARVLLVQGPRGQRLAALQVKRKPGDSAFIVTPLAETYCRLDPSRPGQRLIIAGDDTFTGRIPVPNAGMNNQVELRIVELEREVLEEYVDIEGLALEVQGGQPVLVSPKEVVARTNLGHLVRVQAQAFGPLRQPSRYRRVVMLSLNYEKEPVRGDLSAAGTIVRAQFIQPTPASLGLERVPISVYVNNPPASQVVFGFPPRSRSLTTPVPNIKTGPLGKVRLRLTVVQPRIHSIRTEVLPIESVPASEAAPTLLQEFQPKVR